MRPQLPADEILQSEAFAHFYRAASEFCAFVEKPTHQPGVEFLKQVRGHLFSLYRAAVDLPWVDLKSNVEYDNTLDPEQLKSVQTQLSHHLGAHRFYWHVFDPTNEKDTEAACGDLLDDLQDMYRNLKSSLVMLGLDPPDCKKNAIWQFKFDFEHHWDDHCMNAMSAIHFYLQDEW